MWEEKKAGKEAMFVWPKSFINFVACISVEITGCKNNVEVVKQIKESPGFYSYKRNKRTVNEEIHEADRIFLL